MSRAKHAVYWLWLLVCWSCGTPTEDLVVARVGEVEIDAPQLLEFEERLHPDLRSKKTGADAYFDYLQTIIDKELMVLEAKKRGLDQRADFRRKMDKLHNDRVLRRFLQLEVYDKIVHTQEEMLAHQRETGRDRAVQVRRIVVATVGEARAIKAALEGGDDFDVWASHNLLDATQLEGGRYLIKDELYPRILQEKVFPLAPGQFSEPVLFNDQFGVYEVTAEVPVKLSVVQSVIEAELLKEKLPPAVQALSARLRQELDFVVHDQALERVRGRIGQGAKAFSAEEREQPIYEHESGTFTIGDLLDFARELGVGFPEDAPEQFDWFVRDIVEPRALLLAGAYTAGVDREEAVVAWFQERQLSNLLVAMRRDVVDGVFASREEAREFYDRHSNLFRPLESIGVQEILVRTEEEALALREEVERGGDLGALAAEHTLRRRGKANQGEFHLHPWEKQQFVPLFEAAQGQKIGAFIGPIALEVATAEVLSSEPISGPYYAIFRLLDSTINAAPRPFAQAERRARALVRRQKQERLFGQFIIQLRHEYAAQIEVFRAQVEALVRNT
ncbi:MAG: peptidylprolyl isomerase [Gemmatimonadota bacterium]|nr:peptidylprolyl isomerase [Gemmatimonadota bacterium]